MTQRGPEAFLTPRTELLAGDPDGTLVGRVRAVVAGASTRGRVVLAESASVRAIDVWAGPGGIVTHGYRRDEASATAGGLHDPELGAVVLHDLLAAAVDDVAVGDGLPADARSWSSPEAVVEAAAAGSLGGARVAVLATEDASGRHGIVVVVDSAGDVWWAQVGAPDEPIELSLGGYGAYWAAVSSVYVPYLGPPRSLADVVN